MEEGHPNCVLQALAGPRAAMEEASAELLTPVRLSDDFSAAKQLLDDHDDGEENNDKDGSDHDNAGVGHHKAAESKKNKQEGEEREEDEMEAGVVGPAPISTHHSNLEVERWLNGDEEAERKGTGE